MQYLIFSKETNELIDIFKFEEKELEKYLAQNVDFYAEESEFEDIEDELSDDIDDYSEFAEENWE